MALQRMTTSQPLEPVNVTLQAQKEFADVIKNF